MQRSQAAAAVAHAALLMDAAALNLPVRNLLDC
jgi:hypothetical protein